MRSRQRSFAWISAVGSVLLLVSTASMAAGQAQRQDANQNVTPRAGVQGQNPQAGQRPGAQAQQRVTANRPVGGANSADHVIAEMLAISNQEEIALNKLAANKVHNKQVREFAEQMIKEHSQLLDELRRFGANATPLEANTAQRRGAPGAAVPSTTTGEQQGGQIRTPGQQANPAQAGGQQVAGQQQPGGLDFVNIKRQIAQQCLASAQRKFNELQGDEVDLCFMGQQAVMHQQMIDAETVLRQHVSPELQQVIDQSIQSAETHLKHADKIIRELAGRDQNKSGQDRDTNRREESNR